MCPTPYQNCENYPTPLGELSSDWIRVPLPYSFIVRYPFLAWHEQFTIGTKTHNTCVINLIQLLHRRFQHNKSCKLSHVAVMYFVTHYMIHA